jgi:hypothetical protein
VNSVVDNLADKFIISNEIFAPSFLSEQICGVANLTDPSFLLVGDQRSSTPQRHPPL